MKIVMAVLAFLPALASVGCSGKNHVLDGLSDDELALYLETGAREAVKFGVDYAVKKYPDKTAQIQKDGQIADDLLRNTIIKNFSGAASADVAKSAINQAIQLLSSRLTNAQIDGLVLIAGTVLTQVSLPQNPTDKLSARTKMAVAAFFTGMAEGLEASLKIPPPGPAPAPPPPPK